MGAVLIVEDDGLVAGQMGRTLRQAGHMPIIAQDARSALEEAADRPDIVLLDLGLPDLPGEDLLQRLKSRPDTAPIPILTITGKGEGAPQLSQPAKGRVAALASHQELDADALGRVQERQGQIIQRLIVEGSDSLAFHACRRLSLDPMKGRGSLAGEGPTWADAERAKREGVVNAEEARLLRQIPPARARVTREL
jgi:CheY-like chemotaxis protein